jgi:hypothetical protein
MSSSKRARLNEDGQASVKDAGSENAPFAATAAAVEEPCTVLLDCMQTPNLLVRVLDNQVRVYGMKVDNTYLSAGVVVKVPIDILATEKLNKVLYHVDTLGRLLLSVVVTGSTANGVYNCFEGSNSTPCITYRGDMEIIDKSYVAHGTGCLYRDFRGSSVLGFKGTFSRGKPHVGEVFKTGYLTADPCTTVTYKEYSGTYFGPCADAKIYRLHGTSPQRVYSGPVVDRKPHGPGSHIVGISMIYTGSFSNGKFENGTVVFNNATYTGAVDPVHGVPLGVGDLAIETSDQMNIKGTFKYDTSGFRDTIGFEGVVTYNTGDGVKCAGTVISSKRALPFPGKATCSVEIFGPCIFYIRPPVDPSPTIRIEGSWDKMSLPMAGYLLTFITDKLVSNCRTSISYTPAGWLACPETEFRLLAHVHTDGSVEYFRDGKLYYSGTGYPAWVIDGFDWDIDGPGIFYVNGIRRFESEGFHSTEDGRLLYTNVRVLYDDTGKILFRLHAEHFDQEMEEEYLDSFSTWPLISGAGYVYDVDGIAKYSIKLNRGRLMGSLSTIVKSMTCRDIVGTFTDPVTQSVITNGRSAVLINPVAGMKDEDLCPVLVSSIGEWWKNHGMTDILKGSYPGLRFERVRIVTSST